MKWPNEKWCSNENINDDSDNVVSKVLIVMIVIVSE
jgi:hypothetical protein